MPALVAELKPEVRGEVVMALLEPLFMALGGAVDPHSLRRTTDAVDALLEAPRPELTLTLTLTLTLILTLTLTLTLALTLTLTCSRHCVRS